MIDELGLAGGGGGSCQVFPPGKHIDKGRLAYVGATRERILGIVRWRAQLQRRTAPGELYVADVHGSGFWGQSNGKIP